MNNKPQIFLFTLLAMNMHTKILCSDMRDYFAKKNQSQENFELSKKTRKLERTVDIQKIQNNILAARLAQAEARMSEHNAQINK